MRVSGSRLLLHVDGGMRLPPGGIAVSWGDAVTPRAARVNGKPAVWHDGELRIDTLPADVAVELRTPNQP